ncbi:hypothetical protein KZ829_27645 [Actinoplanes hulinensis]|uniref:Orc1-like AAA ATPase domain-containing protein n=1 Tax=Actinoplanes hulinensis TaxID=1144547 RepID=A0ABS7BB50_9ACTN|nr:hypothetical protein [Actinoplanes hulinensis]MBW6437513.1 hypothetical protein [Actinoplanes hulinensis]
MTDTTAALWLALAPSWTGEAALAAGLPVASADDEDTYFARLSTVVGDWEQQGLAQRNGTLTPDQMWLTEFWHTAARRRTALESARAALGRTALAEQARRIAVRLRDLDLDIPLAPVMRHWIELAVADTAGRPFLEQVRDLCRFPHVAEAQEHITAAEIFEPVAGPAFRDAVEAARRLLRLAVRRAHDRHSLRDYQPRKAWTADLRALLSDDSPEWAMHLIGAGGTGKTSFVRYVASGDLAEQNDLDTLIVGRVDFDYLSPAYPAQRPAHLLTEFADELAPEVRSGAAEEARAAFYRLAAAANEATGAARADATAEVVQAFVRFLSALPGRILLILDTCEELSRTDPSGTPDAALTATFQVLAAVHRGLPGLRVLLCGRRPMNPGPEVAMRTVRARGFTEKEATRYLTRPDDHVVMQASLVEAILELSPERTERPDHAARRFSPFDVRLYREWWASEKDITVEQLRRSGRSAYVQERIVGRLTERWSATALPAVAMLGTFDARTLESVIPDHGDIAAVIAEFARQDWIDTRTDPAGDGQLLEVNASMRPLLRIWARAQGEERLLTDRRRLARTLGGQVQSLPLEQLSVANVVSALRLITGVPAVQLWERLEARMATPSDWSWMGRLCPRVLGALAEARIPAEQRREGAVPDDSDPPDDLLIAAVRATAVAVAARAGADFDRSVEWQEVLRLATGNPEPVAERLRLRARLGVLTAATRRTLAAPGAVDTAEALIRAATQHDQLTGGIVAAIEAVAETEPPGTRLEPIAAAAHDWLAVNDDPVTTTCVRLALYRLTPDAEDHRLTARDLDRAVRDTPTDVDRWADWIAPPSILIRLDLHLAARAYLSGDPLQELPLRRWERDAETRPATLDTDRLLSVCLHLRLGHGTVARDHLDRLRPLAGLTGPAITRLRVHRIIPPLFQSLSYGYLMLGDTGTAQRLLDDNLRWAREQGDTETVRSAVDGLLWLGRRLRRTLPADLPIPSDPSDPDLDGRADMARALTDGTPPPASPCESAGQWHRRWQALSIDPRTAALGVPPLPERMEAVDPVQRELLLADLREATAAGADVAAMTERIRALPVAGPGTGMFDPVMHTVYSVLAVAAPAELGRFREDNPARPPLFLAVAALELGEQRALRDPAGAKPLLDLAAWLSESRSPVLGFQAATLAALAHVHEGADRSDLTTRALVLGLNTAYTRMREHVGGDMLPEWAALTDVRTDREHPWAGWLTRVRVAITALAGRPDHGPPAAPAVRPVELYPIRFGTDADADAEAGPVRGAAKFVVPRLDGPARLRLSLVAMQARFRRIPQLTVQVLPRPRKLVLTTGREPWRGAAELTAWSLPGMGPFGAVRMGAGDAVPDLSASMRAMAGEHSRRVWRLILQLGDQVRFWEDEITERLGMTDGAVMPRWYREWPPGAVAPLSDRLPDRLSDGLSARRNGGSLVRVLDGRVGRSRSEFRFVERATRQVMTPADVAGLDASAIVLRTTAPADGEPDEVRDIDALRLAVRCMAAGVRNLLLLPRPSASAADQIAEQAGELNGRAGPPRGMDLMALADSARNRAEPNRGHVVLFLRGEPDDGIG